MQSILAPNYTLLNEGEGDYFETQSVVYLEKGGYTQSTSQQARAIVFVVQCPHLQSSILLWSPRLPGVPPPGWGLQSQSLGIVREAFLTWGTSQVFL